MKILNQFYPITDNSRCKYFLLKYVIIFCSLIIYIYVSSLQKNISIKQYIIQILDINSDFFYKIVIAIIKAFNP